MLGIVQHEQHLPVPQEGFDAFEQALTRHFPHSQNAGNIRYHQRRVAEGRERHEGEAVREFIHARFGHR